MTKVDEQTVERVAKAMWEVVNRGVEMGWESAVRFERMAQAAIASMQYNKVEERNDALREAARAVAPKGDEPSVDPSNHGDTAELAYWWEAKSNEEAILALIDKENTM